MVLTGQQLQRANNFAIFSTHSYHITDTTEASTVTGNVECQRLARELHTVINYVTEL